MKNKKLFCLAIFIVLLFCNAFSQDSSFTSIHKLVEAKEFKQAIPKLKSFIVGDPKHVSAHYDLALCYDGIAQDIVTEQNANVLNQNTSLWGDSDYQKNIQYWKDDIDANDSAILYYKETSELMNIKFLTLDLRYDEFYHATKDCDVLSKVKCARAYLAQIIEQLEKTNAANKAVYFNVQKDYDSFKAQLKKDSLTNIQTTQQQTNVSTNYFGKYSCEYEEGTMSYIYLSNNNGVIAGYEEYDNEAGTKTKTEFENIVIVNNEITFLYSKRNWKGHFKDNQLIITSTGDSKYSSNLIYEKQK